MSLGGLASLPGAGLPGPVCSLFVSTCMASCCFSVAGLPGPVCRLFATSWLPACCGPVAYLTLGGITISVGGSLALPGS